ncbi:hypothetical protein COT30_01580 [Candidatus Micrarchaeota archaeon CG08_land_8_20_14_0_20_49_17]|nr:MAG: hypothetical protein AUJ13_00295 [Candidatus Micrarchaeota archaeon CG1_02_49_24]PIU09991.1 MAG: hypothetical protein COT30_01580 [Candidatus Micrarchaeota archaeon CG08_land_8_20_14_0_20_49_17]HII54078.1 hypothetical protein [Candidatus Micrarchaeota archaeon]
MDLLPKRKESGPLERFKNQNAVLKQFGEPGYLLYNAIDGAKTLTVLQEELAIDEAKLVEMLEYMQGRGMITIDEVEQEIPARAMPEEEAAGEPAPAQEEEESPAPENVPLEEPAEEKRDEQPFITSAPGRIAPIEEEESAAKKKKTPKPPPVPRGVREDVKTNKEDQRDEGVWGNQNERAHAKQPSALQFPQPEDLKTIKQQPIIQAIRPDSAKKETTPKLSALERIIYDKYGMIGIRVYNLIDGEKSAEDILNETGISEDKFIEMLEFMDKNGIIKLEKPWQEEEEKQAASAAENKEDGEAAPESEPAFPPMDENETSAMVPELEAKDALPIDLVARAKVNGLREIQAKIQIGLKYGNAGLKVYDLINGEDDIVHISLKSYISLEALDAIFAYFGELKLTMFKKLSREEIAAKYGEDGLMIFKKYGREGILLYELIGKEKSLKDLIARSQIDPERAVKIFLFIHKILGLDFPININTLYKQLGIDPSKPKPPEAKK